jgi:hypothetical protein
MEVCQMAVLTKPDGDFFDAEQLVAAKFNGQINTLYDALKGTLSTNVSIFIKTTSSGETGLIVQGSPAGIIQAWRSASTNLVTILGTGQISSSISGIAPIFVSSSIVCSNLNADLLDGQHGSSFATSGDISSLQADLAALESSVDSKRSFVGWTINFSTLVADEVQALIIPDSVSSVAVRLVKLHYQSGSPSGDSEFALKLNGATQALLTLPMGASAFTVVTEDFSNFSCSPDDVITIQTVTDGGHQDVCLTPDITVTIY